jgi:hypothetical protein
MADRSLSVIGGTYGADDSGIVEDSGSEYGRGGGGIEDDVDEVPVGVDLLRSARGPVGTFWYPPRGA